ncbi:AraC family transcriptional regulator [Dyella sp. ASV21]|uniref:helix-turn-helix domain-containing protein n=1 Tax=Dyella sp. ASV21 TaxID=2795114 RepID=UPI0018ECC99B
MTTETVLDVAFSAAMLGLGALAALLVPVASRHRASRFLAGYFVCVAIDSLVGLVMNGWRPQLSAGAVRWLHAVNVPLAYLYGVLLYGYVLAVTSPPQRVRPRRMRAHLYLYGMVLTFSLANALFALDDTRAGAFAFLISYHGWVVVGLVYLALLVQRIYRARPLLEQSQADEAALTLGWLRGLAALLAVSWIVTAVGRWANVTGEPAWPWLGTLLDSMTMAALFALAWSGAHQRVLVPGEPAVAAPPSEVSVGMPAYAHSALDANQCMAMAAELDRLMAGEHLYVDSQFDLAALSRRSGWSPNYVSQALNQGRGQNFFEFVNGYRVAAAERYLADPAERRTILEVALACGFGSKSTFNAVFKRITGQTPSGYRRALLVPGGEPAA